VLVYFPTASPGSAAIVFVLVCDFNDYLDVSSKFDSQPAMLERLQKKVLILRNRNEKPAGGLAI
jgi:hypothetical protein